MTEGPDWGPTFKRVAQVPGKSAGSKQQLTEAELFARSAEINRRNAANLAVAHGAVDTGPDFDPWGWFSGWSTDLQNSITANTEAIANLEEIAAATNVTAAWVSDLEDMATIPRALVKTTALTGNSSAPKFRDILDYDSVSSSGTSEYRLHRGICPTIRPVKVTGSSQGHIYYTPIIVDRRGTVDRIRWIVGADTSLFSINYYEMALCIYNPDTGDVEKVWGSGDIKDGAADTTTLAEVFVSMGIDQECTPGQILFVAHQQTAPSALQVTRRFAAIDQLNKARTVPLLDAACYVAQNHSQGIPSSISFAALSRENRFLPYAAVSVNALESP
ncbi:hypothetical protein [Mycobacterium sp. NAZ190054]|uniref:hypothetical protein n=1 Tax=Mycobacterium sp. NAZ190054 TaxID=1747766 RepID=UPI00079C471B|nr:hypothetical protein [Mycobacterium sp. NAZ190054]KWX67073.1 hypothetical protein ASJ79_23075 [Mycobacterium sp. NAZ190054]